MEFELLRGVENRIHLINCRVDNGHLYVGAAYLPAWLEERTIVTDGTVNLSVILPEIHCNQSSPGSCVDLVLELA